MPCAGARTARSASRGRKGSCENWIDGGECCARHHEYRSAGAQPSAAIMRNGIEGIATPAIAGAKAAMASTAETVLPQAAAAAATTKTARAAA